MQDDKLVWFSCVDLLEGGSRSNMVWCPGERFRCHVNRLEIVSNQICDLVNSALPKQNWVINPNDQSSIVCKGNCINTQQATQVKCT